MSKIKTSTWYTVGKRLIGIIECFDEITEATKFYIGYGDGKDRVEDEKKIAQSGAKFNPNDFMKGV